MARIALDAIGGDFAPSAPVTGALEALTELPDTCEIVLIGPAGEIEAELKKHGARHDRISVVDAPERIEMGDKPLAAIRTKRNSSIVVGMEMHQRGEADAFISAGNTGAVMAAAALLLRMHKGIERPAIGTVLPTIKSPSLFLDAGANVDCSARELLGFALLGTVYARDVFDRPNPKVGLLNVGAEEEKGNAAVKEAYPLFRDSTHFEFVGNVEGSDILAGTCDVIVCDGFTGNAVLKFYESVGRIFAGLLKQHLTADILQHEGMTEVYRFLDYSSYGGAPLLGVKGVPIICHGRSTPRAFASALRVALHSAENHLSQHIGDEFVKDEVTA